MTPFHLRARVKDFFRMAASPSSPKGPTHSPPRPVEAAGVAVSMHGGGLEPEPAKAEPPNTEVPKAEPVKAPAQAAAAATPPGAKPEPTPEEKAKEEERQRKHWARVRKGMLKWLVDQGGKASMSDMHAHSEAKYFVAHRAFSRLMEEYTAEEFVTYGGGMVELTDAGRSALA